MGNGQKSNTPVTGTDFYPTLLELVGADLRPEEHIDGVSLVPLLKGGDIDQRPLIWHYPHYGNQGGEPSSIIREGDWKLIHYYEDGRDELYYLKSDLGEQNNLASRNPEKVLEMSQKLFGMLDEMGARFPNKDPEWTMEKERAHLERIINKRWPQLEGQRMKFLSKDFDPGNNWWGSQITRD